MLFVDIPMQVNFVATIYLGSAHKDLVEVSLREHFLNKRNPINILLIYFGSDVCEHT